MAIATLQDKAIAADWNESDHPRDEAGKFTDKNKPTVHVADDPKLYADPGWDGWSGVKISRLLTNKLTQPNGAPVRGEAISPDDERIPDTVYHMTTNLSAVLADGMLRAGGEGGLGGDNRDQIVSMTLSREIANQLAVDMRFAASLFREFGSAPPIEWNGEKWTGTENRARWGKPLVDRLIETAEAEGWKFHESDGALWDYGFSDWLRNYFVVRESRTWETTKLRNPLIYDAEKTLSKINPDNIGVVAIPKGHLKTGALITNFDLDNQFGLQEIRAYGDIPIGGEAKSLPLMETKTLGPHKYSCVLMVLPPAMAKHVTDWAIANIPEFHLAPEGRENRPHITALYGIKSDDPDSVRDVLENFGLVRATLGKTSLFRGGKDGDVLKVEVDSPDLHRLNAAIRESTDCHIKFPEYVPHLTLAYLHPDVSESYAGLYIPDTSNAVIVFDDAEFSGSDGTRETIPLSSLVLSEKSLNWRKIGQDDYESDDGRWHIVRMHGYDNRYNPGRDEWTLVDKRAGEYGQIDVFRTIREAKEWVDRYLSKAFNPAQHPRGQPDNAGQFTEKLGRDQILAHIMAANPPEQICSGRMTEEEWAERYLSNEPDGYIIMEVHPRSMNFSTEPGEPGKVENFAERSSETAPFIVVDSNEKMQSRHGGGKIDRAYGLLPHVVVDGKHRVAAALRRGDKSIKAAVPVRKAEEIKKASHAIELEEFAYEYAKSKGHTVTLIAGDRVHLQKKDGTKGELTARDLDIIARKLGHSFRYKSFDATKHPRGQPRNAGQFSPSRGGSHAREKSRRKRHKASAQARSAFSLKRLGAMSFNALKTTGVAAQHVEHIATEWVSDNVEAAVDKLPGSMQKLVRGVWIALRVGLKTAFMTYLAGQKIAEEVAKERGLDEEAAKKLRATLSTWDVLSYKPVQVGLALSGVGLAPLALASIIPIGTATYLAYSSVKERDPLLVFRAAANAVKGAVGMKAEESSDSRDLAEQIADALAAAPDQDAYFALLMAALDETRSLARAVEIAGEKEIDAKAWDASKHPRGQPNNAGQFVRKGGKIDIVKPLAKKIANAFHETRLELFDALSTGAFGEFRLIESLRGDGHGFSPDWIIAVSEAVGKDGYDLNFLTGGAVDRFNAWQTYIQRVFSEDVAAKFVAIIKKGRVKIEKISQEIIAAAVPPQEGFDWRPNESIPEDYYTDKAWNPNQHPRGQPNNAGQFVPVHSLPPQRQRSPFFHKMIPYAKKAVSILRRGHKEITAILGYWKDNEGFSCAIQFAQDCHFMPEKMAEGLVDAMEDHDFGADHIVNWSRNAIVTWEVSLRTIERTTTPQARKDIDRARDVCDATLDRLTALEKKMVSELVSPDTPDWRPDEMIPEDYYVDKAMKTKTKELRRCPSGTARGGHFMPLSGDCGGSVNKPSSSSGKAPHESSLRHRRSERAAKKRQESMDEIHPSQKESTVEQARRMASEPTEPPKSGDVYHPNVLKTGEDGITEAARVGVPGREVPPPPATLPRLPNLTPDERAVEEGFAKRFEENPDELVKLYDDARNNGRIGDAPNIFSTDDVKALDPNWTPPEGMSPEEILGNRARYNLALHQTANAVAKKSFLNYLDRIPDNKRSVLVTAGGCGAGKGYAIRSVDAVSALHQAVGAVWDSAGDQNSTELPWIHEECSKRGIKVTYAYVHADPRQSWASEEKGVVSRAKTNGRMVDAHVFVDSYSLGAQNFKAFSEANQGKADFVYIHNVNKPQLIESLPPEALNLDREVLYRFATDHINECEDCSPEIKRGATAGARIWGPIQHGKSHWRYFVKADEPKSKEKPAKKEGGKPGEKPEEEEAPNLGELLLKNLMENSKDPQRFDQDQFTKSLRYSADQKERPKTPPPLNPDGTLHSGQKSLTRQQKESIAGALSVSSLESYLSRLRNSGLSEAHEAEEFARLIDPYFKRRDGFVPRKVIEILSKAQERCPPRTKLGGKFRPSNGDCGGATDNPLHHEDQNKDGKNDLKTADVKPPKPTKVTGGGNKKTQLEGNEPETGDTETAESREKFAKEWDEAVSQAMDDLSKNNVATHEFNAQEVAAEQDWHSEFVKHRWGMIRKEGDIVSGGKFQPQEVGILARFISGLMNRAVGTAKHIGKMLGLIPEKYRGRYRGVGEQLQKFFDGVSADKKTNSQIAQLVAATVGPQALPIAAQVAAAQVAPRVRVPTKFKPPEPEEIPEAIREKIKNDPKAAAEFKDRQRRVWLQKRRAQKKTDRLEKMTPEQRKEHEDKQEAKRAKKEKNREERSRRFWAKRNKKKSYRRQRRDFWRKFRNKQLSWQNPLLGGALVKPPHQGPYHGKAAPNNPYTAVCERDERGWCLPRDQSEQAREIAREARGAWSENDQIALDNIKEFIKDAAGKNRGDFGLKGLREVAKNLGITGISDFNKAGLALEIQEHLGYMAKTAPDVDLENRLNHVATAEEWTGIKFNDRVINGLISLSAEGKAKRFKEALGDVAQSGHNAKAENIAYLRAIRDNVYHEIISEQVAPKYLNYVLHGIAEGGYGRLTDREFHNRLTGHKPAPKEEEIIPSRLRIRRKI